MATSGKASASFNNSSFTLETRWYATSQNIALNYTEVLIEAWLYCGSRISASGKSVSITVDGTTSSATSPSLNVNGGSWLKVASTTKNIYHAADGKKTFNFSSSMTIGSLSGLGNIGSATASGSGVLNTISKASALSSPPSYTMFNKMPISIARASSNFTHKALIYVGESGQRELLRTVDNLTTGTNIEMSLEENTLIMQKLSGVSSVRTLVILYTYNNNIEIGYTENVGYIKAPPKSTTSWSGNFTTGNILSGVITKAWESENITSTVQLIFEDQGFNTVVRTKLNEWSYDTSAIEDQLYNIAGNRVSITGVIRIYTYYNSIQIAGYYESPITAYMSNAKPVFLGTSVSYKDVNSNIVAITNNDKYIIQGKSSAQVNIPIADLAIGQKGATIKEYTASLAGQSITKAHNGSAVVFDFGVINASSNQTLSIKARDSRGLETEVTQTVSMVRYASPASNVRALRRNGFEETTSLSVSGSISDVVVNGASINGIANIQYRYKELNGTFTAWTNFTRQVSLNSFTVTPVDLLLDETKTFIVEFGIQDKFGLYVIERVVNVGIPMLFLDSDKKWVGIGKFPKNGPLDVEGDIFLSGEVKSGSSRYLELTMYAGWTHKFGGFTEAGFRKDELGYVDVRGTIKGGTVAQWTVLGTLPVGYRPNARRSFVVSTDIGVAILDILANGNIAIRSGASTQQTSLDGIRFYVGDVI